MKLTKAALVDSLIDAPSGAVRVNGSRGGGQPADGLTANVALGEGAFSTIINPQSFKNGGPEWRCRYGNIERIRYMVASLLEDYDYLLSDAISTTEAIRRLRILRSARAALTQEGER